MVSHETGARGNPISAGAPRDQRPPPRVVRFMFEWITGAVERTGYVGVFLLMLAENVFPPIPSEVIMPLAGFVAARGELDMALVIAAGSAGSLAGTSLWWWAAARIGYPRLRRWIERHGHWLTLEPEKVDRANAWFRRHCGAAVFFGRLVPGVRTVISLPAGFSGMTPPRFLACSALGTALWTSLLAFAGFLLEHQHEKVSEWLNPATTAILAGVAAWYAPRGGAAAEAAGRAGEVARPYSRSLSIATSGTSAGGMG